MKKLGKAQWKKAANKRRHNWVVSGDKERARKMRERMATDPIFKT